VNKVEEITIKISIVLLVLLALSIFLTILELNVTFKSPIVFGDESFHTRLAQYIAENIEFPVFTPLGATKITYGAWIKPPLLNILGASSFFLFGTNFDAPIRFLLPFTAFLTCVSVFLLAKKLFDEKIAFIAAVLTITIPSIVTYSVTIYTDLMYTFYATLFFLLLLLAIKENRKKYLILSAVFGGIAMLTDISGLAIPIFLFCAFLYETYKNKNLVQSIKKYILPFVIIVFISGGFFIRNIYYFSSPICYSVPFLNKVLSTSKCSVNNFEPKYQFAGRTEAVSTEQSVYSMGIVSYVNFAYGNLLLVPFAFLAGLVLLLFKKSDTTYLIFVYLFLFLLLFFMTTERAEDAPRTTLAWAPIFALVSGVFFGEVYNSIKKYLKYGALVVFVIILIIGYQNFKEKLDTMYAVKQFSPLFFESCNWVKENTPKNISLYTVWAWRALYNCQRNAVGMGTIPDIALSRDVNYVLNVAKQHGITHIFIQKFSIDPQNRHYGEYYDVEFVQFLEDNPQAFIKVYENGVNFDITNRNIGDWANYCYRNLGSMCDGNVIYEINATSV
jgi:4-amino-4-deoxy-L-arabinose transferase-like glycosyltransferase